jgi:hypothetical protein
MTDHINIVVIPKRVIVIPGSDMIGYVVHDPRSPEICQDRPYSFKTDIWSLGCILYEMMMLHHPFQASSLRSLISKVAPHLHICAYTQICIAPPISFSSFIFLNLSLPLSLSFCVCVCVCACVCVCSSLCICMVMGMRVPVCACKGVGEGI